MKIHHRRLKGDSSKTIILEAAKQLFFEKGYSNTGIREIADRCSTNCAMLNYYFQSKEKLCMEIIDSLWIPVNRLIANLDLEIDYRKRFKKYVYDSISEAFSNKELVLICLNNRIIPASNEILLKIDAIIDHHYRYFKLLAEKALCNDIELLYRSIFAFIGDVLCQNKTLLSVKKDKEITLEDVILFVDKMFLTDIAVK
ncbi:MAG: helix-turn-helix domain-containing protein [Pedobacter sp.]|uniref:TetR/AcrR family transcriptional regulator n=1 Tax=Pedobacter sp. TaxID=1411316 RepID=UPI003566699C